MPVEHSELKKNNKGELEHPTCGKIIPKNATEITPGHYIYKFYDDDVERYPGYQPDKHPDGLCLPCCFKRWNTDGRILAKQKCALTDNPEQLNNVNQKTNDNINEDKDIAIVQDDYIMGPEKTPLSKGRWGYLPPQIQLILKEINADCQISKTNTNLKPNYPCLLRHGIEINNKQSFISCISDALFFGITTHNKKKEKIQVKILNNSEMKQQIIKSLTIDEYIKYQNGNLTSIFYDKLYNINHQSFNAKYPSVFFSKLNMNIKEEKFLYEKTCSSFINFISYLNDDTQIIDHSYLWDIVSKPNKHIFENGINLIIFNIPDNDISNNVELICPTNHYSNELFNSKRQSLIIVKYGEYYEPIYSYSTGKKLRVNKFFSEYDKHTSPSLKAVINNLIKPFYEKICKPLNSMPENGLSDLSVYTFKTPLLLDKLLDFLDIYNYKTPKMVVNFNNKVIGVISEEPTTNNTGFIPCYPSAITDSKRNINYVFMNDETIWNTYDNTIKFLKVLNKRSSKRKNKPDIPCNPVFNIIEEGIIIGILTETNQLIPITNPIPVTEKKTNIPNLKDTDYIINNVNDVNVNNKQISNVKNILTDIEIMTSLPNNIDTERTEYVKKIKMETNFYNVFRNTIRIILNDYENIKTKEKIINIINNKQIIYPNKLKYVMPLLIEIVGDLIEFIGDEKYYKAISEISTCIINNKTECEKKSRLCSITDNGKCNIILPEKNLLTHKLNQYIYFGKLTDELIRFNKIQSFMFQPQTYLSLNQINYNLNNDEILIIQSLLTQDYFDTFNKIISNKYTKHITRDNAIPIIHQPYNNTITTLTDNESSNVKKCASINNIKSSTWKKCLPENYSEITYDSTYICSFKILIDLVEKYTSTKLTISDIKINLFNEYKKLMINSNIQQKILDILIIEGKKLLGEQVKLQKITFGNFILSDTYFITGFDIWILLKKYNIPAFFISQKPLMQYKFSTKYKEHNNINDIFLINEVQHETNYAFIIIPGLGNQKIPQFKLITNDTNDLFIPLQILNDECMHKINYSFRNTITIDNFLNTFTKIKNVFDKTTNNNDNNDNDNNDNDNDNNNNDNNDNTFFTNKSLEKSLSLKKTHIADFVKKCDDNKEFNPITKRCNAKCNKNQIRNEQFKCIPKNKTQKNTKNADNNNNNNTNIDNDIPKKCDDNKEFNPITKRCNAKCNKNQIRNEQFKCIPKNKTQKNTKNADNNNNNNTNIDNDIPKKCDDNKEFNPITKRCNAKCNKNQIRNGQFKCIPKNKVT